MSTGAIALAVVNGGLVAAAFVLLDQRDTARVEAALNAAETSRVNIRLAEQTNLRKSIEGSRDEAAIECSRLRAELDLCAAEVADVGVDEDYDPTDAEQGPLEQGWAASRRDEKARTLEWVRTGETTLVCRAVA